MSANTPMPPSLAPSLMSPSGTILLHRVRSTTGTGAQEFAKPVLVRLAVPKLDGRVEPQAACASEADTAGAGRDAFALLAPR